MRGVRTRLVRIRIPDFEKKIGSYTHFFFKDELRGSVGSVAAIYAAKKALGSLIGIGKEKINSIHIKKQRSGKPFAVIPTCHLRGVKSFDISLSHEGDYAVAFAAVELEEED